MNVREIAAAIRAEARDRYAAMKHSSRLTAKGAEEKMRKLLQVVAPLHVGPMVSTVLNEHRWPYESICSDSRFDFRSIGVRHHPKYLFQLFEPEDVIWCGEVYEAAEKNFRTREVCVESKAAPAPLTCPSTFKPGHHSRGKENILHKRFLVVESDTLDRNTVGAIYRWLKDVNGLNLRAVIDTAGKSLHAWFSYPVKMLEDLKLVLPGLGCDPRMFVPSQPCRMPGVGRNGSFQRLIYQS